jgi:hypothetical protein
MPDKKDALAKSTPTAITVAQPLTLEDLCKVAQVQVDAMSFSELNTFIENGILCINANLLNIKEARIRLRPALIRIHDMCGGQGKRNDLTGGVTWTAVCSHLILIGCKRTLDGLIKDAGLDNPNDALPVGTEVKLLANGTDRFISHIAEVTAVHDKTNPSDDAKVDVAYKTKDETGKEIKVPVKGVRTIEVEKIKPVKLTVLKAGTLYILDDVEGGAEVLYEKGILTRTTTPSPAQLKAAEKVRREEEKKANTKAHGDRLVEAVAAVKGGLDLNDAATQFKVGRKEISSKLPKVTPVPKVKAVAKKKEATAAPKAEATPKPQAAKRHRGRTVPYITHVLGGKFFVFDKGEVEFSSRTVRSVEYNTLEEARANAKALNIQHGFGADAATV